MPEAILLEDVEQLGYGDGQILHGEGILRSRADYAEGRICGPVGNVVRIQLSESASYDAGRLQPAPETTSSRAEMATLVSRSSRVVVLSSGSMLLET